MGASHVELDALNWEPNWTTAPTDVFRRRVTEAVRGDRWIVDGNYSDVRDVVWSRATALVWLDYSLARTLGRLFWRTFRRVFTREDLWSGNRERLVATQARNLLGDRVDDEVGDL